MRFIYSTRYSEGGTTKIQRGLYTIGGVETDSSWLPEEMRTLFFIWTYKNTLLVLYDENLAQSGVYRDRYRKVIGPIDICKEEHKKGVKIYKPKSSACLYISIEECA